MTMDADAPELEQVLAATARTAEHAELPPAIRRARRQNDLLSALARARSARRAVERNAAGVTEGRPPGLRR